MPSVTSPEFKFLASVKAHFYTIFSSPVLGEMQSESYVRFEVFTAVTMKNLLYLLAKMTGLALESL
jgi:hypothetical protein